MSQRFQIEDLVVQDGSGVVFRAWDTETNQQVALRRFFPFGAKGGGLDAEEQIAYNIAVERLSAVSHPSLRAVIGGGCDPIDGMPFIATEWIEGTRLQSYVDRGPLTPDEATNLLTQALEVCQLLSEVLAEEAVWVETGLQAIVVGAEGTGRGITFWIAPLKWLGKNDSQRGLASIVTLTEAIMGWNGRASPDQAGRGLGEWLKWLRGAARTTSLHEAREMLAASIGVEPPLPAKHLVRQATRSSGGGKKKKKSSGIPFAVIGCAVLAATALGGWALVRRNSVALKQAEIILPPATGTIATSVPEPIPGPPQAGTPPPSAPVREKSVDDVNRQAAEMVAAAKRATAEKEAKTALTDKEIADRGGVFTPSDSKLLAEQKGRPVVVEGVVADFEYSKSKATLYLVFSQNAPREDVHGAIFLKDVGEDLHEQSLRALVGKKIRMSGNVDIEGKSNRLIIPIKSRSAIQEVK